MVLRLNVLVLTIIAISIFSSRRVAGEEETYQVEFETSISQGKVGKFIVEVYPEWAPLGAQRFKEIIEGEIWNFARFFRVVQGFMVREVDTTLLIMNSLIMFLRW
jgi:hypothetical protein